MRVAALGFLLGVCLLQWSAVLPEPLWPWGLAAVGLLALGRFAGRLLVFSGMVVLGYSWAAFFAANRLADALPASAEGLDVRVTGVVAGLPQEFESGLRFDFDVETAAGPVPGRIALAWYRERTKGRSAQAGLPAVAAGERWQLTVRLRRPHGNLNPHGFDYEAWLLERGVRATGYVRRDEGNRRLNALVSRPAYLVQVLRQSVRDRFQRELGDAPHAGILVALAIGDQRAIAAERWQVFARTGVTHLLSVSGLHVTMVAGLAGWLAAWCWRRSARLPLRLPAQKLGAAAAFVAAFAYCLLAGFGVPAQRTLYMLSVVALAFWTGRLTSASRVLALAMLLVLLLDPWAVLAPGFWLSFGAVALLFLVGAGRLGRPGRIATWLKAQWAITLGLIPLLLVLFQQFSLVSPLANLVAIPLVSLLITPMTLLGMLPGAEPLLHLAHWLTSGLMSWLDFLAASSWSVWQQAAPPAWALALGLLGAGWLLMPPGLPGRWLGLVMILPMVSYSPPRPATGEVLVRVLDVGQGLAVHVQTAGHDLLYDAGPAYSEDANSGDRVIVPYLRAVGVKHLHRLVVSHADQDHAGGAAAILAAVPTDLLLHSLTDDHPLTASLLPKQPCRDGERWQWDGVAFQVLHPPAAGGGKPGSNGTSCVLHVRGSSGRLLLTGDIEAKQEKELLIRHGHDLAAEVLVPPHHGSRGASTAAFLAAVGPRQVVFSAGYRNRFGHPSAEVVARAEAIGAATYRTDQGGAVTVVLAPAGLRVEALRQQERRYWRDR